MAHFMAVRLGIVQRIMGVWGPWPHARRDTRASHRSLSRAEVELTKAPAVGDPMVLVTLAGCRVGVRAELCRRAAL